MDYVLGVDIYSLNLPKDWKALYDEGVRFVIVKASEGSYSDGGFSDTWQKAKAAGMLRGAYHFFHPELNNIKEQADLFIQTVGSDKGELPPVLDLENVNFPRRIDLPKGKALFDKIQQWMDRVESAFGRKPMIYTRTEFITSHAITNPPWGNAYSLWLAQYPWQPGTTREYTDPANPPQWSSGMPQQPAGYQPWVIWQWAAHGRSKGFGPNTDVDIDLFKGTVEELYKFAGTSAPVPVPPKPVEPTTTTYTIAAGDTLASIAANHNISLADLVNMNNAVLAKEGTQLTVPSKPPVPPPPPPPPPATTIDYLVKANDTLGGIALQYRTTVDAIMAVNPQITNRNFVRAGSTIKIPKV